jgi:hypothetical protein
MRTQLIGTNKYLITIDKRENKNPEIIQLRMKLENMPSENVKKISDYNYEVTPDMLSLTENIGYGPFTKREVIEAEIAVCDFMRQFDDPMDMI